MIRHRISLPTVLGSRIMRQLNTSCVKSSETHKNEHVNQFSENFTIQNENAEQKMDESHHDYIHTSNFQRIILSVGSSVAALVNPHR